MSQSESLLKTWTNWILLSNQIGLSLVCFVMKIRKIWLLVVNHCMKIWIKEVKIVKTKDELKHLLLFFVLNLQFHIHSNSSESLMFYWFYLLLITL